MPLVGLDDGGLAGAVGEEDKDEDPLRRGFGDDLVPAQPARPAIDAPVENRARFRLSGPGVERAAARVDSRQLRSLQLGLGVGGRLPEGLDDAPRALLEGEHARANAVSVRRRRHQDGRGGEPHADPPRGRPELHRASSFSEMA